MHEFGKKLKEHMGTSHSAESSMGKEVGHHHEHLGEHEKRALEGNKHHHESSL